MPDLTDTEGESLAHRILKSLRPKRCVVEGCRRQQFSAQGMCPSHETMWRLGDAHENPDYPAALRGHR